MAQLIFGRFFWIWILSFLATASYLCALSVNQIVRLSYAQYEFPESSLGSLSGQDDWQSKSKINKILSGINLIDPTNKPVTPPPEPRKKTTKVVEKKSKVDEFGCPPLDPNQEIPESTMNQVRLKGTSYVATTPEQSLTAMYVRVKEMIPRNTPKELEQPPRYRMVWNVEFFRVGDMVMPDDNQRKSKVCAIGPREVILFRNNKFEKFSLDSKKKKNALYYGSIGVIGAKEGAKGPGEVKIRDEDKFSISRSTVNGWLANPMEHAMSARIMPHYQNGEASGLRLVWVREKSLYSQIGLQSGDVVQQINGKTLSVSSALGLYSELPYAKQIQVNIIRKGVRRTLLYSVK